MANLPALRTTDFIARSAAYAAATVKKANKNGNAYLTKTESAALPKDLRDNYENHRAAQGNSSVIANKFVERYAGYVAQAVDKADKNNDGWITSLEVKNLPADLRDNFWNAWKNR